MDSGDGSIPPPVDKHVISRSLTHEMTKTDRDHWECKAPLGSALGWPSVRALVFQFTGHRLASDARSELRRRT